MERVAFLVEETGGRIDCLLNPEDLVVRRLAGVRQRRSTGGVLTGADLADDVLLFTGGGMTEMFLNLLFDVSLVASSIKVKDVRDLTAPLWRLSENTGSNTHQAKPALVRFVWGKSWNVAGIVASISERLDYFDSAGRPLRSWLRMRFLRVVEPSSAKFENAPPPVVLLPEQNLAVQDATVQTKAGEVKVHQYAAGERLDQLVGQYYGYYAHPALWRWVAAYNAIADPLHVPPGTILQFPPLTVLQKNQ
jgi:hypothetical protein